MNQAVVDLVRPDRTAANKPIDSPDGSGNGISVVICTYNGSPVIRLALEALSRQDYAGSAEVLVVDNNSNDGVAEIAERYWSELADPPFPLRCVREGRAGIAFARRTGVTRAKYDTIIFCDDDNLLAPDYLTRAVKALADPAIGAVAGACVPVSENALPPFFYTYATNYTVGAQDLDPGPVNDARGWLFGAGLAARRRDLLAIYESEFFPILTGRAGSSSAAGGDDLELCFSLRFLGYQLVYDEQLTFRHFIEARKLSKDYIRRLRQGDRGDGHILLLYKRLLELDAGHSLRRLPGKALRLAIAAARGKWARASAIWFWMLSLLHATWLMTPMQLEVYRHYRRLTELRKARAS